jgi:hypothetical protein
MLGQVSTSRTLCLPVSVTRASFCDGASWFPWIGDIRRTYGEQPQYEHRHGTVVWQFLRQEQASTRRLSGIEIIRLGYGQEASEHPYRDDI